MRTTHKLIELTAGPPSVEFACIDPARVWGVWPLVSHWIKAAMRRGDFGTFRRIEDDVLSGGALLWVFWDGTEISSAVVTQIGIVESGKVCTIIACGGDKVLINLKQLSRIEGYARKEGCRAMRIVGRKCWARALKEYKQTRVVLEKEFN